MYLDYAEHQAEKDIIMTMKDWINKLNAFFCLADKFIVIIFYVLKRKSKLGCILNTNYQAHHKAILPIAESIFVHKIFLTTLNIYFFVHNRKILFLC